MNTFITTFLPNVSEIWDEVLQSTWETLYMTLVAGLIAGILGVILGVILVVTEDAKSMRSEGTRRNMEYTWKQLTCNFIHIRDHQQQSLRCCECSSQGTGL